MRTGSDLGVASALIVRVVLLVGLCVGWLVGPATGLYGQDAETMTLHAYTSLVEIPVLVLSPSRKPMAPVEAQEFGVRLNSGPMFRPAHVRREGDDPLTIGILLDGRNGEKDLLPGLGAAVAGLLPDSLGAEDRVLVYSFDCGLSRYSSPQPASQAMLRLTMKTAVDAMRGANGKRRHEYCNQQVHLWDAMAYVSSQLGDQPGRRVLLAVTGGRDDGSVKKWNDVKDFATRQGVTIFGLSEPAASSYGAAEYDDLFTVLCERSGGMRLLSSPRNLPVTMEGFIRMLRERYILGFPRPNTTTAGWINLEVSLGKRKAFIRPAGISVPLPDRKLQGDPLTVPSDPSRGPQVGSRRMIPPG